MGELKHDLVVERSALRLMVLAWILRRAERGDASSWSHAVAYARLLGETDELLIGAGRALEADSPLSRWLLFAEPGGGGRDRWLDTPGPLLRALGLTLVLRDNPHAGLKPHPGVRPAPAAPARDVPAGGHRGVPHSPGAAARV